MNKYTLLRVVAGSITAGILLGCNVIRIDMLGYAQNIVMITAAMVAVLGTFVYAYSAQQKEKKSKELESHRAWTIHGSECIKEGEKYGRNIPNGKAVEDLPDTDAGHRLATSCSFGGWVYYNFFNFKTGEVRLHRVPEKTAELWFAPGSKAKVHGEYAFTRVMYLFRTTDKSVECGYTEMRQDRLRLKLADSGVRTDEEPEMVRYFVDNKLVDKAAYYALFPQLMPTK